MIKLRAKVIISVQSLLIVGLIIYLCFSMNIFGMKNERLDQSILMDIDKTSYKRVNELVERYNQGKGDNLMIIQPTIDSGPWIHNIYSNGSTIEWTIDLSRDGMSGNTEKLLYICKSIQMKESSESYYIELSNCKGFDRDQTFEILAFFKDEI